MSKNILSALLVYAAISSTAAANNPSKYIFHQQFNDMCMIAPMINLPLLNQLKENGYDITKMPAYTRREWFVLNQKPLRAWHKMLSFVNRDAKKIAEFGKNTYTSTYQPLLDYFERCIKRGPIMPHFYNSKGSFAFKGASGAADIALMPYALVDYDALIGKKIRLLSLFTIYDLGQERPWLGVKVPFVQDSNRYKIFYIENKNIKEKDFDVDIQKMLDGISLKAGGIDDLRYLCQNSKESSIDAQKKLFKSLDEKLNLELSDYYDSMALWRPKEGEGSLNFTTIGLLTSQGGAYQVGSYVKDENGYSFFKVEKSYVPYMQGLYKMMLLRLGLGLKNDPSQLTTEEEKVFNGLKKLIKSHETDNPWRTELFSIDKFFQYEITEILKENTALLKKVKNTINFYWKPWQVFQNLKYNKKYYREDKTPYLQKEVEDFLPSDEQALAFMIGQAIRMLFYGACSKKSKAFYKAIQVGRIPGVLTFSGFAKGARKKKRFYTGKKPGFFTKERWFPTAEKISFLSVWKELRQALFERWKKNNTSRKDWISFDGHGWIISFDKELLKKLALLSNTDKELLKDLGFACIESWLGSSLETFYKSTT